ncbi:PadR family transcriptional regulator [Amnibacterium sp. CER49]|uniref:PadR family transcriptional regulator n=1 Tax=Amnibacterium sp. CER49 TaxID=3039161 RepID=UPI002449C9E3|nr:PadR family transcriptional regulator [Amnibacterium sp. CER49]MDH2445482.1 PadR family transcriptional regulator [Amnibacterium sp. CER49]
MSAPIFAHGQLRLYLLSLLGERPMHGYDLIQALSERFGGTYAPSAGTIYPRLARLEEEGLVTKESDGRRTVYAVTDAGREELARRGPELAGLEDQVSDSVRRLADEVRGSVNDAMRSLRADLAAAARDQRAAPPRQEQADDPRVRSRRALAQAEAQLARFRGDLRGDLRSAVAAGSLLEEVPGVLARRLDEVRAEVAALLHR